MYSTQQQILKASLWLLVMLFMHNLPGDAQFANAGFRADTTAVTTKLSPALQVLTERNSRTFAVINKARNIASRRFILTGRTFIGLKQLLLQQDKWLQIVRENEASRSFVIDCTAAYFFEQLLQKDEIIFADLYMPPQTESGVIGYVRHYHGINMADYALQGANGKNIVVGIKEQKPDSNDLDLYKRVIPASLAGGNVESHATVISTLVGGAGNTFYDGRGIANACRFYPSYFGNLFADDAAILNQNNVTVQNHSYGTVIQPFYGAEAVSYDVQCWQNKKMIHVFSAGNQGTASATAGPYTGITNYCNITGNFKMAKNVIDVAAIDDKGNIAPLSSAGPAYDGRLVPQLTALGPNGTSDAAAIVSGTAAVLQQVYADSNSQQLPPASLIKAALYTAADDIGRAGIDFKTGYGLLNSYEAIKMIREKKYDGSTVAQAQVWQKDITVLPAAAIKITLAWTDTASAPNNIKALVNDLDLEVVETATGTIFKPWVLSTAASADSLEKLPVRKRDSLNTAEQVSISLPAPGLYRIRVTGTAISGSPVPFSVAYKFDTLNTLSFTNPRHTTDINRAEIAVLPVKWKTAVADTNQTGTLSISYNGGSAWQVLQAGIKIYRQQYNWDIKDTASTALFRMQTSFGDFLSSPVIISPVIRPQVDYNCADSFRLSWKPHVYTGSYAIYAITDSAYMKKIRTVTDTFAVFSKSVYPYLIYAVEPLPVNNIPASRSLAVNISLQGVNCFYRALNYTQLDSSSIRLSLELSTTAGVDSISFERITAGGQVLQSYGSRHITGSLLVHLQTVTGLPSGISYFRARIRLANGAVVYSDIATVLTSGDRSLLVYPNPLRSGSTVNYFLRNQSQYFRLQLLNAAGQHIKEWEVAFSGTIQLPVLTAGVYILRLVDLQGKPAGYTRLMVY